MIDRPKHIILANEFFGAQKGDVAYLQQMDGTYPEVCDMCGKKRKCALYISNNDSGTTFIDVCRECSERLQG